MARATCTLLLLAALTASVAAEPEPRLIADDPGALIELEGESQLEIRGLQGTLALRPGKPGELRYEARTRDNQRSPRPVALWVQGRKLSLRPVDGDGGTDCLVELAVPPGLAVDVGASSSIVSVYALDGPFRFSGTGSELMTRGLTGRVDLQLTGGKVQVSGSEQAVRLESRDAAVLLEHTAGPVTLQLAGSTLDIQWARDTVEGDLDGVAVTAGDVEGLLRLTAAGGSLELQRASGGATLDLSGTPLALEQTRGEIDVVTDAPVTFARHDGPLKILGYGAAVTGSGSVGPIDVETDGAEVRLEQIGAGGLIRGRDLDLQLLGAEGDLTLRTMSSKLLLKRVGGPLTIDTELGTVEVAGAAGRVTVNSRNGDVLLRGLKAPLALVADGGEVDVGWVSLAISEDVSVQNSNGSLRVQLPRNASVRIDAHARSGRVESDVPGIEVSEDGHTASGLVSEGRVAPQAKRPALHLRSEDDLYIGFDAGDP